MALISIKAIEFAVKNLPQRKLKVPDGFTAKFYHTFKEEILPTLHKLFQKKKRRKHIPVYFMRPTLPLYQNLMKTLHEKGELNDHPSSWRKKYLAEFNIHS